MSNQAICIEPQGTTRHVPPRYIRPRPPESARIRAPAIPNHMVRYYGSPICHTEFGIRESEFGIWKPDNSCSAPSYFAFDPRKHWSECGSQNSSWCGIFPLDHLMMVR